MRTGTDYQYICTVKETGRKFYASMIDYSNSMVYQQIGQSSDSGEWYNFDELTFEKNEGWICLTVLERERKLEKLLDKRHK